MAGGHFLSRVLNYVVNELIVDRLANSRSFQRFAVRTNAAIESITLEGLQKKIEELKETSVSIKNEMQKGMKDQYKA